MEIIKEKNTLKNNSNSIKRKALENFEQHLKNIDGSFIGDSDVCPLKHSFAPGIYIRELTIPEGTIIVGKIHKHEHPNFILEGEVIVVTEEGGEETIVAPCSMISPSGTKRALYAKTKVVWTTIHLNPTDTHDLEKLEKEIIAENFEDYDRFILSKKKPLNKIKKLLIKKLSK